MIDQDIPRWYGLFWVNDGPHLGVALHKEFVATVPVINETAPIVQSFKISFGFREFVGDLRGNFGFDNVLRFDREEGDFLRLLASLPVFERLTDELCEDCNGLGQRDEDDGGGDCFYCEGKGRKKNFDRQSAYALSASLNLLFAVAQFPDVETSCQLPQLITVDLATFRDMGGFAISGLYSKRLSQWLAQGAPKEIPEMVDAMKVAHTRMFGALRKYDQYRFRAAVDYDTGWLNTSCPGDACGLNPADGHVDRGEGYKFFSHNVDSPMQQLTILASLAALHDLVDKDPRGALPP